MGFEIKYRTLLELNIWNHFFLNKGNVHFFDTKPNSDEYILAEEERGRLLSRYNAWQIIDIQATRSCRELLAKHQLLLKKTTRGLSVVVKEEGDSNQPWIPFNEQLKLTFFLWLVDPKFFNYSQLLLPAAKKKLYYFNNLVEKPDFLISLSLKNPKKVDLTYVEENRSITTINPLHDFELAAQSSLTKIVEDRSGDSAVEIYREAFKNDELDTARRQLDLRHIPSGWYSLITKQGSNRTEKEIYLNNEGLMEKPFAVVELFGRNEDDDHGLLYKNGKFKPQLEKKKVYDAWPDRTKMPARFELRFINRETIWKFFDSKTNSLIYDTKTAFPLTENGFITLEGTGMEKTPPNPSARMIKKDDDGFYSEIFI